MENINTQTQETTQSQLQNAIDEIVNAQEKALFQQQFDLESDLEKARAIQELIQSENDTSQEQNDSQEVSIQEDKCEFVNSLMYVQEEIQTLNLADLKQLKKFIDNRILEIKVQSESQVNSGDFKVGDKVIVNSYKKKPEGTVIKVSRTRCHVQVGDKELYILKTDLTKGEMI